MKRLRLIALTLLLLAVGNATILARAMKWYALGYREESAGFYQTEVLFGLAYAEVDGKPLRLDIYRPYGAAGPHPAVLVVHGGAWRRFDRSSVKGIARFLASQGYVAVPADYRLSKEAPWPACLHDLKAALRWLRANAKRYNIDPNRIAVLGDSAGGHLAAMLGATGPEAGLEGDLGVTGFSTSVRAVVAYYGVYDMVTMIPIARHKGPIPQLLDVSYQDQPQSYKAASPINYLNSGDPPFLLIHGLEDRLVPFAQSVLMEAALKSAGIEVEFIQVENADHCLIKRNGKPNPPLIEIDRLVLEFFKKHL